MPYILGAGTEPLAAANAVALARNAANNQNALQLAAAMYMKKKDLQAQEDAQLRQLGFDTQAMQQRAADAAAERQQQGQEFGATNDRLTQAMLGQQSLGQQQLAQQGSLQNAQLGLEGQRIGIDQQKATNQMTLARAGQISARYDQQRTLLQNQLDAATKAAADDPTGQGAQVVAGIQSRIDANEQARNQELDGLFNSGGSGGGAPQFGTGSINLGSSAPSSSAGGFDSDSNPSPGSNALNAGGGAYGQAADNPGAFGAPPPKNSVAAQMPNAGGPNSDSTGSSGGDNSGWLPDTAGGTQSPAGGFGSDDDGTSYGFKGAVGQSPFDPATFKAAAAATGYGMTGSDLSGISPVTPVHALHALVLGAAGNPQPAVSNPTPSLGTPDQTEAAAFAPAAAPAPGSGNLITPQLSNGMQQPVQPGGNPGNLPGLPLSVQIAQLNAAKAQRAKQAAIDKGLYGNMQSQLEGQIKQAGTGPLADDPDAQQAALLAQGRLDSMRNAQAMGQPYANWFNPLNQRQLFAQNFVGPVNPNNPEYTPADVGPAPYLQHAQADQANTKAFTDLSNKTATMPYSSAVAEINGNNLLDDQQKAALQAALPTSQHTNSLLGTINTITDPVQRVAQAEYEIARLNGHPEAFPNNPLIGAELDEIGKENSVRERSGVNLGGSLGGLAGGFSSSTSVSHPVAANIFQQRQRDYQTALRTSDVDIPSVVRALQQNVQDVKATPEYAQALQTHNTQDQQNLQQLQDTFKQMQFRDPANAFKLVPQIIQLRKNLNLDPTKDILSSSDAGTNSDTSSDPWAAVMQQYGAPAQPAAVAVGPQGLPVDLGALLNTPAGQPRGFDPLSNLVA